MQIKSEIRKKSREKRKNLVAKDKFDFMIAENLFSLEEYKNAKTVLVYVSLDDEIKTDEIIINSLENKKCVACPFCDDKNGNMSFYMINSLSDLKIGSFNIREPNIDECKKLVDFSDSIIIVPGLVFDKSGYRVGFGKGYYDRFLNIYNHTSVGLCYDELLCDNVPRDEYDKRVDIIITQSSIIRMDNGGKNG